MNSNRPQIVNVGPGVYGTVFPHRWNYRPVQRRFYRDSVTVQVEQNERGTMVAMIWRAADGTAAGCLSRKIYSPSDLAQLVKDWRAGYRWGTTEMFPYDANRDNRSRLGTIPTA